MRAQQARDPKEMLSGMWHPRTLTPQIPAGWADTPALCPASAARASLPSRRAQALVLLQGCQAPLPLSAALGLGSPAEEGGVKGSLQAHNA